MKTNALRLWQVGGWLGTTTILASLTHAQTLPVFTSIQYATNREVLLQLMAEPSTLCRLDVSRDLQQWDPLVLFALGSTTNSVGLATYPYTDSATPYLTSRWYRATKPAATNLVTGDFLSTEAGQIVIHPVNHASLVLAWNQTNAIYSDPVGGSSLYRRFPPANLILIAHDHSDHFDATTVNAVKASNAVIIAPPVVYQKMSSALKALTQVLTNGASTTVLGITIEAIPAYNLTASQHPKGVGNGYVLNLGGKRIYLSGDTEDIPEMRALTDIEVAFVCMNQPYTMKVNQAVSAVREFQPRVVYPYHYRNSDSRFSDVNSFKEQVGPDLGIEVRLRNWY